MPSGLAPGDRTTAQIARLDGRLFFGSVDSVNRQFRARARNRPDRVNMVLILLGVADMDLAGVEFPEPETERRQTAGGDICVIARDLPLAKRPESLGPPDVIGRDRLFDDKSAASAAAVSLLRPEVRENRSARVFSECSPHPGSGGRSQAVAS